MCIIASRPKLDIQAYVAYMFKNLDDFETKNFRAWNVDDIILPVALLMQKCVQ